ncbi:lipocalin-like domain-containing protein [Salegentibacter salegens]|uniref:Lipocalin-like domain-containing protein n=1 Tax=Salegentibacter salegens TaxID=143223 RepID=A0A1M7K2W9_9FLAO|nr:lipocalin family protein [Salegentibacter salegens]PRX41931.1 lipocalin-like protein [Salegentibacter salegens]SHM59323.1 Lipocalin-like domain-containing protein [Salegentibacter salegens]
MKKLFLMLFSIAFLASCSEDDDANANGDDPILGTWYVVELENDFSDDELNQCNLNSNITFNADNTANSKVHEEVEGECMAETSTAEWERNSNGQYTFDLPFLGRQTGDVEFSGNSRFIFSVPSLPGVSLTFEK